jgi:L-arabinose transport system substrate-binding protein
MMSLKKSFLFQGLAVLAMAVAGCNSGSGTDTTTTGGDTKVAAKGDCTPVTGPIKIGFIVKSMSDSWFQTETSIATAKAKELGAELNVQEATKGDAVLSAIDTMSTNGVQGIIICSPETQLGTAIKAATDRHKIKLMSVDDRLVGSDGKPITDIPHLGISAANIGKQVGQAISDEMKKRGWKPEDVGAIEVIVPSLQTATERIKGAEGVLIANGFKKENAFEAPWSGAVDVASASDAANGVLTAHSNIKKWVVYSSNDDGVLGAIRSISNRGIPPTDIIGVGINGKLAGQEWAKGTPTGMFASIMLQPQLHGGGTVEMMDKWIKDCTQPKMETYTDGKLINKDNYAAELKTAGITLN